MNILDAGWRVKFEDGDIEEEATAVVYVPAGSTGGMCYEIARIDGVAKEPDEFGDMALVVDGEDAVRLRVVRMIACVPKMLEEIKRTAAILEEITGLGKPDDQCGTWVCDEATEKVWRRLIGVQDRLESMSREAVDLEVL